MQTLGYSSALFGWFERLRRDGRPADLDQIFAECAAAGVDAVEVDPTTDVRRQLAEAGLRVSAVYWAGHIERPWGELAMEAEVVPRAARAAQAGATDFLVGAQPLGAPKTEDDVRRQGDNLSRLHERLRAFGLALSLHNHSSLRAEAEADLRSVVDFAAAEVGLCIDTGWALSAGCDPVTWVRRFPDRVRALHLRNQRGSIPTEDLTDGDLDLGALVAGLASADYRGWLSLELWHRADVTVARSMEEDVHRSLDLLRSLVSTV